MTGHQMTACSFGGHYYHNHQYNGHMDSDRTMTNSQDLLENIGSTCHDGLSRGGLDSMLAVKSEIDRLSATVGYSGGHNVLPWLKNDQYWSVLGQYLPDQQRSSIHNNNSHAMTDSWVSDTCTNNIFSSDTIKRLQSGACPQKPPRYNRPLIRPRPMENLQDITNQGKDCRLWTHGDVYGVDSSQVNKEKIMDGLIDKTMMISQSNFNNQETCQIPEQKIYQVPNFYGEIKSTEPLTPTLQDGGFSFDELPPPPPSPPPGPSGAYFYVGTPPSPEHMTMVFPPPREYSSEDINLELQGMKNVRRCSDGLSQYLGTKRKPQYLDLDEIQVLPLTDSTSHVQRCEEYDPQCLVSKTRKLDLGPATSNHHTLVKTKKGSTDSLDAIDETFDFPTDNDNHKDNVHNEERQVKTKFHQPATGQLDVSDIIQEGWLLKRGEHIKNWRQRYFMLRLNGDLIGFKMKPVSRDEFEAPLNRFSVKSCQIMATEDPRPSCLIIKLCQDPDKDKERIFCFLDSKCRDQWMNRISMVRDRLDRDVAQRKISLDDFEITKVLGRGAFGKVVMCREKSSRNIYAMKMLKKTVLLEKHEVEHTRTENRVLQSLRHPFLVNLKYTFTTSERIFFVMEYVGGGELFEHLGRMGNFPEGWVRFYGGEITLGLAYLHSRGIIYRDLKLENLILDRQGHVKIVDFGLCKDKIFGGMLAKTMCGTPAYMAPEVFSRLYGREVDWWSLGVVLFEMATGELPFYSQRREELFRMISKESLRFPKEIEISFQLKSIIHRLMEKNPKRRLGSGASDGREIMDDIFFASLDWSLLEKRKLTPPFKPQVKHELDNPYIAEEFANQTTAMTPTNFSTSSCSFSDFSFKKSSWSQHSSSSRDLELAI